MDEPSVRLILVGGLLLASLAAAGVGHVVRRRRADRTATAPLDLAAIPGTVLFFSAPDCPSCDLARRRLQALGAAFEEIGYGDRPGLHRQAGIGAVPLIVVRDAAGGEIGRIAGPPGRRRLKRLLQRSGAK